MQLEKGGRRLSPKRPYEPKLRDRMALRVEGLRVTMSRNPLGALEKLSEFLGVLPGLAMWQAAPAPTEVLWAQ